MIGETVRSIVFGGNDGFGLGYDVVVVDEHCGCGSCDPAATMYILARTGADEPIVVPAPYRGAMDAATYERPPMVAALEAIKRPLTERHLECLEVIFGDKPLTPVADEDDLATSMWPGDGHFAEPAKRFERKVAAVLAHLRS